MNVYRVFPSFPNFSQITKMPLPLFKYSKKWFGFSKNYENFPIIILKHKIYFKISSDPDTYCISDFLRFSHFSSRSSRHDKQSSFIIALYLIVRNSWHVITIVLTHVLFMKHYQTFKLTKWYSPTLLQTMKHLLIIILLSRKSRFMSL